ncbi:flagellar biosynthesis protein FlhA [bacterium]|nr:flagellar biosynthesis protein FlhA [FCB group bacterium]MBL7191230.1 flagellar biosynthesis protein FlhA [bacterium]
MLNTQSIENPILKRLFSQADILLASGIIFIIVMMIIPIPTFMVDILLALDITLTLVILLTAIYNTEPLEFSVFPGLLLVMTLFRLGLNITTTRLILSEAYAGSIIEAFGGFVIGGNYAVGLVIFIILNVINFVVITKGSGRIAEVAARFTLDAMPGKQMSIDADLNNGIIDDEEAKARRDKIGKEADFYGAMDGASKFVRGDAVAGIIITFINILGGFIVGVLQLGMNWSEALQTFTTLTVGDGLVSQLPALMISTSAGIIVSRAAAKSNLGEDLTTQLFTQHRALFIVSVVLFMFAFVPGLPFIPFFILAVAVLFMGRVVQTASKKQELEEARKAEEEVEEKEERIEDLLYLDPLEIEIGYSLISLVDPDQGGDLLERITMLRKQFAVELGIVIPPIRIRDNVQLQPNQYVIKLRGNKIAEWNIMIGYFMALNPGDVTADIEGIPTTEPTYGLPAKWIAPANKERAELNNWTVIEPAAVLATHLMEVLRRHAGSILTREGVQNLLDNIKRTNKTLVEELVPNVLSVGQIQKVLQNLLNEGVSIRDLVTILEALGDYASLTKDAELLTEAVRSVMGQTIANRYKDESGEINAVLLEPELERMINEGVSRAAQQGTQYILPPDIFRRLHHDLIKAAENLRKAGKELILVTAPNVRKFFRNFIEPFLPQAAVLSFNELPPQVQINSLGTLSLKDED